MAEKRKNLYYLHELSDYKVSSEDPDVRGWDVKDRDNRVIGKVDNLLVNKEREQVVYLDVEVDPTIIEANHDPYGTPANSEVHEFINKDGEEHIIIPVGLVNINEDQKFVYTDRIDHQTFSETKRIQKGSPVERDYEVIVLESYDRFGDPDANRREREGYDDDLRGSTRHDEPGYVEGSDRRDRDFDTRPGDSFDSDRDRRRDSDFIDDRDRRDRGFETRPDDTYEEDYSRRESRSRDADFDDDSDGRFKRDRGDIRPQREGDYDTRGRRDAYPDDDTFYDRREFDRRNWRRRT